MTAAALAGAPSDPVQLLGLLGRGVEEAMAALEDSKVWRLLSHPHTPDCLVWHTLRELHLEIIQTQPTAGASALRMLARLPAEYAAHWRTELLSLYAEDTEDLTRAVADYDALGGDPAAALRSVPTPTAFAVNATWAMLADQDTPGLYFGARYLQAGLTATVTACAIEALASRRLPRRGLGYLAHHAREGADATRRVGHLILDADASDPAWQSAFADGFAYLRQVYPLPGWLAALHRARQQLEQEYAV